MTQDLYLEKQTLFIQSFIHAPIGMALVSLEGHYLKVNAPLCDFFGYTENELLHTYFFEKTHADLREKSLLYMKEIVSGKQTSFQHDQRYQHKLGRLIWGQLNGSIIRDEQNEPLYFLFHIQDITNKKQNEFRLQEKGKQYKSLFDYNRDALFSVSLDGTLIEANSAWKEVTGYDPAEISSPETLIDPHDVEHATELFYLTVQGKPQSYETTILHKEGYPILLRVMIVPIINDEKTTGVFYIAKDITKYRNQSEQLEKVREMYQLMSENTLDWINLMNSDGTINYISPAIEKILGYVPEDMIGTSMSGLVHPDDWKVAENHYLNKAAVNILECRMRHRLGHYVWIETTLQTIRDEDGTVKKYVAVGRDITKRKKAEDELHETKERLESFFQTNADAFWITDMNDVVTKVNTTFETMFGWKADEVTGMTLPTVPSSLTTLNKELHDRVKAGESIISIETQRLRKDGELFYVNSTLSPVRNAHGEIIGISGICRDITKRKQVIQEAQTARQQLESFVANHSDAVVIFSSMGHAVRVNQAFEDMLGWIPQEILGEHLFDIPYFPNKLKEKESREMVEAVRKGEHVYISDTFRINKSGEEVDVSITAFPMQNLYNEFDGWAVVLRDMRQEKKSQQLLQQSEKLSVAGQLAAGIAHEIRNPITSIKGFLQLMQTGYGYKEQYMDIMTSEIDRIEIILAELLILAKPQVKTFQKANIRALLEQVIALLGGQGNLNNIEIHKSLDIVDHPYIECDQNQMKQVFINFIKNSMEAMPDGGKISIDLRIVEESKQLSIRFIDEGSGIHHEIIDKIGDPFFTTKEKGTGLGFMISKKIIEDHGGSLTLTSAPDKGTMIEVFFPI